MNDPPATQLARVRAWARSKVADDPIWACVLPMDECLEELSAEDVVGPVALGLLTAREAPEVHVRKLAPALDASGGPLLGQLVPSPSIDARDARVVDFGVWFEELDAHVQQVARSAEASFEALVRDLHLGRQADVRSWVRDHQLAFEEASTVERIIGWASSSDDPDDVLTLLQVVRSVVEPEPSSSDRSLAIGLALLLLLRGDLGSGTLGGLLDVSLQAASERRGSWVALADVVTTLLAPPVVLSSLLSATGLAASEVTQRVLARDRPGMVDALGALPTGERLTAIRRLAERADFGPERWTEVVARIGADEAGSSARSAVSGPPVDESPALPGRWYAWVSEMASWLAATDIACVEQMARDLEASPHWEARQRGRLIRMRIEADVRPRPGL